MTKDEIEFPTGRSLSSVRGQRGRDILHNNLLSVKMYTHVKKLHIKSAMKFISDYLALINGYSETEQQDLRLFLTGSIQNDEMVTHLQLVYGTIAFHDIVHAFARASHREEGDAVVAFIANSHKETSVVVRNELIEAYYQLSVSDD